MKNHSNIHHSLYVWAIVVAVSLTMTGCKDDIKPENEQKQAGKIAVNLRMTTENSSMLKVANDNWEITDQIGLYMKKAGQSLTAAGTIFEVANNLKMTFSDADSRLKPETPFYYPEDENVDFVAYYPWNAITGAACTIAIDMEDQSVGLPTELLYSNNAVNKEASGNVVDLIFKYAYAKLELTVYFPDRTTAEVAEMTASITGMYSKATFQLANGTFTAPQAGIINLYRVKTQNSVAFFEALLLPATVGDDAKFIFETGDKTYALSAAGAYEAGQLYVIDRALGAPDEIEVIEIDEMIITSAGDATSAVVNYTLNLTATITPNDAFFKGCTWSSSNPAIATVTAGAAPGLTATVKALSGGTAIITATAFDRKTTATFEFFADKSGNHLINPGFEIGTNNNNNQNLSDAAVTGWEHLTAAWFNAFYPEEAGTNHQPSTRVGNNPTLAWWTGNGAVFSQPLPSPFPYNYQFRVGNYICRAGSGGSSSGGFYQIVPVTPGETYTFGGKVGARGALAELNTNARMMILSRDGMTVYHSHKIDFEEGDPATPELTKWQVTPPAGTVYVTLFVVEGKWTNTEGVTEVRLHYDHRFFTGTATPIICWDEMFFQVFEETDESANLNANINSRTPVTNPDGVVELGGEQK